MEHHAHWHSPALSSCELCGLLCVIYFVCLHLCQLRCLLVHVSVIMGGGDGGL
jgi:hypothetical protein